jgi:hypothetical protein
MRKSIYLIAVLAVVITTISVSFKTEEPKYEYRFMTTIESIIPMGIGRSRIILEQEDIDPEIFATTRTDGHTSAQGDIVRGKLKIKNFEETKLLNFYSAVGINFQNIASNDAIISAKLTQLGLMGWELVHVASGVESDAGKDDGQGIFITRYTLKRKVQ